MAQRELLHLPSELWSKKKSGSALPSTSIEMGGGRASPKFESLAIPPLKKQWQMKLRSPNSSRTHTESGPRPITACSAVRTRSQR